MFNNIFLTSIIIFSYFSTGFLECLSQNIPTLGFWTDPLFLVVNRSKKDFIIHLYGDKNKIDLWREQKSIDRTKKNRPDLYKN